MTVAPRVEPLPTADVGEAVAAVRERGLRVTASRRLLIEALFAAQAPVSAEQIAAGLGGTRTALDLTSVYRNLERLEQLGIVRHLHAGHGPGRYVLASAGEREYLACERCGNVVDAAPDQLDDVREQIASRFGYQVRFTHFPLVGLCQACSREASR